MPFARLGFPTLIAIITMFFAGGALTSSLVLTAVIVFAVFMTLVVSRFLSATFLRGAPSSFTLELPPYRAPQLGQVLVRSVFDRTLFVLGRAAAVAAPAGLLIWLLANIQYSGTSLLLHFAAALDPLGHLMGMDGVILLAFLLGFPANELVMPLILMGYLSTGTLAELPDLTAFHSLLTANGWTWVTAVCVMLFSLLHFPCSTTCLTIRKESGSWSWTVLAFLLPTVCGAVLCILVAQSAHLLGF